MIRKFLNINLNIKALLLLVIFLFSVNKDFFASPAFIKRKIVKVNNAVFDLRKAAWDKQVFGLDGQWEFYWNKFIAPGEFDNYSNIRHLVKVPSNWTNYKINGKKLPKRGYATYHIRGFVPRGVNYIAISLRGVFTSYKLFVNGKFIGQNGRIATNPKEEVGTWLPRTYIIHLNSDTVDIVLQVSNYIHFKSGVVRFVVIGAPEMVYKYNMMWVSYESILLGAMLIMALYFLFLFYYDPRNNLSSLYLSLVLIGQSILTGLDGEYILYRIFPYLNYKFAMHVMYIIFFYRTVLFIHFLYHLVPREFSLKMMYFLTFIFFAATIYVLAVPIWDYDIALYFYMLSALLLGVYILYSLLRLIKYQIGALYTLIGLIILFLTGLNDVIFDLGYIHTFYMLALGFLTFVFMLSVMIAMYNARAQGQVLAYSLMLKKLNVLREELIRIPFYDLANALKIIVNVLDTNRGVWIDSNYDELYVSYETILTNTKEVKKNLNELPGDFINKLSVKLAYKYKKLLAYSFHNKDFKRSRKHKIVKHLLAEYLYHKKKQALAVAPIVKKGQVISLIYFENRYKKFGAIQKKLLTSIMAQLAAIKSNADSYYKLQQLNKRLEELVEERTTILKKQEKELQQKELELREKVEELKTYNEQINRMHAELEESKNEIEQKNFELEKLHNEIFIQKEIADRNYRELIEKIRFAQQVQELILRIETNLPFRDLFILYLPKNIVSGDFYWIRKFGKKTVVAVADCTGHGVPGAFMSILGSTLLNEIFNRYIIEDPNLNIEPSIVLDELKSKIIKILGQDEREVDNIKDGMDLALVVYDEQNKLVKFSGAYLSAYIVRGKDLYELKGDRQPIGIYYRPSLSKKFTTKYFQVQSGDVLYLTTDGYADQFNTNGVKFFKKNLKRVFIEIAEYSGSIQRDMLFKIHKEWRGEYYQVDDILVLGIIF